MTSRTALLPLVLAALAGCNICGGQTVTQYSFGPTQMLAVGRSTGLSATTAGIVATQPRYIDGDGHFTSDVLDGSKSLVFTIDDDVGSTVTFNEAPLVEALDAAGHDLRKAHQALAAGTVFTASARGHYTGATVTAAVADDAASPLTLSFDVQLEGAQPAELTGTQPFEAVDQSYYQSGACG